MGGGTWTTASYCNYASTRGYSTVKNSAGTTVLKSCYKVQDLYTARTLEKEVNPRGVIRECVDSEEHPNTVPVILGLDVTGSMGAATAECAKKLNEVMTELYKDVKDVEFCCMGIGDFYCDRAPLQVTQFESDIRIAEQLEKVWFEGGGGGNAYESYTAAWWFGVNKCKLDCWKRGKKGIIITMGDEPLNPYINVNNINGFLNEHLQGDVRTEDLWKEVTKKYDVYHLVVDEPSETAACRYKDMIEKSWGTYLDKDHLITVNLNNIATKLIDIIKKHANNETDNNVDIKPAFNENGEIVW